ncbi:MAG: hypothetical protein HY043_10400 [Verrucomicrobia bacterium]|nr:hypothetical protein [Verrucomicrobiota bacterium]
MKLQFNTKFSAALLLVLLPALGVISFNLLRLEGLRQRVRELGSVKFAALRASATAAAMQHALRVAPYRAMLGSETGNDSEMKAATTDGRQFSAALRASLDDLAALSLGHEARDGVTSVRLTMTNYLSRADEIIALALAGQTVRAHEATLEFNANFEQIQDRLARLNTLLENEIRQNLAAAAELSSRFRQSAIVAALAGAIFALAFVPLFARLLRGSPGQQPATALADHRPATSAAADDGATLAEEVIAGEAPFVPLLDRRLAEAIDSKSSGTDMELLRA